MVFGYVSPCASMVLGCVSPCASMEPLANDPKKHMCSGSRPLLQRSSAVFGAHRSQAAALSRNCLLPLDLKVRAVPRRSSFVHLL